MADPTPPGDVFDEHEYEDSLEPKHLIRRSHVVLKAGIMMLGAGTSALRVREVMQSVAHTLGVEKLNAHVSFTGIVLTVGRRSIFRTQVAEIRPAVNAHRIAMIHELSKTLPERATASEVAARLKVIEQTPKLYPEWILVPLVALACASVAVLANAGWREVAAVLPASALAYWLHRRLTGFQLNHLAVVLTSAAVASGLYLGFSHLLDLALGGPSDRLAAGFVCASIFLIPGFPLVTAGLELTRIDLDAGVPRLAYAAMVLLAITIGVWLVASLAGLSPIPAPPHTGPAALWWTAMLAASFFAVFGWATMFNSPPWTAVASGIIAALATVPRLLLLEQGMKPHVATFLTCVLIGLGCAAAGALFSMEKIIMTVPTLLVVIPGSSALRALIYLDQAEISLAVEAAIATFMGVIAMVAGLSGARMLTDPEWAFTRPDPPTLELAKVRRLLRWASPGRLRQEQIRRSRQRTSD